ncbi:MAG: CocE/NonD family hydrolase [Blastocatellia bacterium]
MLKNLLKNMKIIRGFGLALLLLVPLPARAQLAPAGNSTTVDGIDLVWGVKIPLRDGVKLNANVYKPKPMAAPLPVIVTLTPYTADSNHAAASYFARNGYVFVVVDARGRGDSEGVFDPFLQESKDGPDVIEWLAAQPWSNGRIAMWGGSYAGSNQWATLKESPRRLKTIVPVASVFAGVDFPFWKNIQFPHWLAQTSGVAVNRNLAGDDSFWIQKYRELYLHHRPFKEFDQIVGVRSTRFQTWVSHLMPDTYWDAFVPTTEQFARLNAPILTITGYYDGSQAGAMEFYKRHMQHASAPAREQHYLIIGPWNHSGTRTPRPELGGLKVGEASLLNMNKLLKEWYDWTLKDGQKPAFLKKRIAYYVPGAEEWKYADSLETIAGSRRILYLNSVGGRANDVFQSGSLTDTKPATAEPDKYTYDPLDTRSEYLQTEKNASVVYRINNFVTDQTAALNLFGGGLVYHSAPFERATEISGYVKLAAWMAIDTPDVDLHVTLHEILPDGTSILLTQDMLRARYRESLRQEKLVKPGEINRYEFNGFYFFSRRIARGSRLRLVLSTPNSIYVEKNYGGGGIVAKESGKDARVAHVTLYHDAQRQSFLEIPVVR